MEELKEEVRLIRTCLEEVVVILTGRYTERGRERNDKKGMEECKGGEEGSKENNKEEGNREERRKEGGKRMREKKGV